MIFSVSVHYCTVYCFLINKPFIIINIIIIIIIIIV